MSLYQRNGIYYTKFKYQGKVIRRSTGCRTRRDAYQFQEKLRERLNCSPTSHYTFSDAAQRWLEEKSHKRSLSTDQTILAWLEPHLGNTYLSDITRDRVEQLRKMRLKGSSTETVNRYLQLLRAILRSARDDWEWIDKIPKVPMYPKPVREARFLTSAEFKSLVTELPPHLSAPAWFAVTTGLRTAAIQSLQWDWIDRSGLSIPARIQKNQAELTIPLSMTAWFVLAEQMLFTGKGTHVFVTPAGKPWSGKFTTRAWKSAAKRAGIPDLTFHDLRHTWASWMLQKGVPVNVVQELGGWKTREAMDIYARFSTESLERLAGYV